MVEGNTTNGQHLRFDRPSKGTFPALSVDLLIDSDVAIVTVVGDLDVTTAPRLREVLEMVVNDVKAVTLDMKQVTYMDVAGFQALLPFAETPTELHIRTSSRSVRRLLELVRGEELLGKPESHQHGSPDGYTHEKIGQIPEPR